MSLTRNKFEGMFLDPKIISQVHKTDILLAEMCERRNFASHQIQQCGKATIQRIISDALQVHSKKG